MTRFQLISCSNINIHKRAKCGSGGVCLFVKQAIILSYNVCILDKSFEDILWVNLSIRYRYNVLMFVCATCR